ncbi:hypothetical protein WL88_24340 [Burkholderia diffusa]|uniref:Uncharacterized protein n=1 Tax=Burkholderia diffusa TaxID=488732 RepID=A0AAW3P989_9BURK|nr:hypothetical protein [Burkholderia diffusa]KVC44533.1 hypothetical protein WI71_17990 [Burkholderia diffusa]KVG33767.1 hypothetical protein WJ30_08695 [Burkholderia diffusa]KVH44399.1 hypothetical protein WJ39_22725 [Burkholderia diffusa]KVM94162.1 hypothetical protein WJ62_23675 [Burkholderia diffusa]KWF32504.1 hypothetical protein WL86_28350 [Burkholderia diffusa]
MAVDTNGSPSGVPATRRDRAGNPNRIKYLPYRLASRPGLACFLNMEPRLQMQNPIEDIP